MYEKVRETVQPIAKLARSYGIFGRLMEVIELVLWPFIKIKTGH
jgi:hypothetical protein